MMRISCKRRGFPPAVIQYAVWVCFRSTLSLRDVEEMLAHRCVEVSYETMRAWSVKFWSEDRSQPSPSHGQQNLPLLN